MRRAQTVPCTGGGTRARRARRKRNTRGPSSCAAFCSASVVSRSVTVGHGSFVAPRRAARSTRITNAILTITNTNYKHEYRLRK